jgi:GTP-binding protein YchF
VEGSIDPIRDIEIIHTELLLADIETVEKRIQKNEKLSKTGDKVLLAEIVILKEVLDGLNNGTPMRLLPLSEEKRLCTEDLHLITAKPVLYVINVFDFEKDKGYIDTITAYAENENSKCVVLSGDVEAEIALMDPSEQAEYYEDMGIKESGLKRLIREAYTLLGLGTYFTAGPKEVRAWTIDNGTKAPQAAGVIHSDFERGFIRAEVFGYDDLATHKSELKVKEKGLLRIEGKDYVVKDGDIMHFRFSV